ncbi:sporulation protein YabP [Halonatronum saccharophilum]|uniref:sporulation protein YabP n=1 Tax=Halonatronum saccharophilum TaxID=150060 RepID=UPI0004ACCB96|nr:sporulation protein YabP [Halonatronum saccharophilum]
MEGKGKRHHLTLADRKKLELSGVIEVVSFSEEEVLLETNLGNMIILGEGLHVKKLDLEEKDFSLEGYVKEIKYDQDPKVGGFIKRLFK